MTSYDREENAAVRKHIASCLKYAPVRVDGGGRKGEPSSNNSNQVEDLCEIQEIIGFIFFKESFWLVLYEVLLSRYDINRTFENAIFIYLYYAYLSRHLPVQNQRSED